MTTLQYNTDSDLCKAERIQNVAQTKCREKQNEEILTKQNLNHGMHIFKYKTHIFSSIKYAVWPQRKVLGCVTILS